MALLASSLASHTAGRPDNEKSEAGCQPPRATTKQNRPLLRQSHFVALDAPNKPQHSLLKQKLERAPHRTQAHRDGVTTITFRTNLKVNVDTFDPAHQLRHASDSFRFPRSCSQPWADPGSAAARRPRTRAKRKVEALVMAGTMVDKPLDYVAVSKFAVNPVSAGIRNYQRRGFARLPFHDEDC